MAPDPLLCRSSDCGTAFAVVTMRWPGAAPLDVCLGCALRAAEVAQAMGFTLDLVRIEGASIYGTTPTPSLRQLLEVE